MPCPSSHAKPGRKSVPPLPLIAASSGRSEAAYAEYHESCHRFSLKVADRRVGGLGRQLPGRRGRYRAPQTRACVLTHSVPHIIDSPKIRKTLSGCSRACSAIHCCFVDVVLELRVPPSFPPSGSDDVTPPFPRSGPGAPVPRYQEYYEGAKTPCTASRLAPLVSPAGTIADLLVRGFARALPPCRRSGTTGRGLDWSPGPFPTPGICHRWTRQGLPGFLANHPVAMPTFSDPGRSLAPHRYWRFRCCPRCLNDEGTDIEDFEAQ